MSDTDNTTNATATGHSDAEIQIIGTLIPNPLPRSLPEGSIITVRLEMTLQKSDSPLSFYTKNSFIAQNQKITSRFSFYHSEDGNTESSLRRIFILPLPGTLIDTEEDLMTLYPGVTVSVDVATEVYTKSRDGEEQQYFFGSRLSALIPGKAEMCLGAAMQPILWLYWGTKEDIIDRYVKNNGHAGHTGTCSRSFRAREVYGWAGQPRLCMRPIEISVVE